MQNKTLIATLFIAVSALSTGASAQKVYRCGNTYSQTPCGGDKTIDAEGTGAAASAARKRANDKENHRQVEAAKALEKQRLAEEAEAQKRHEAELKAIETEKARAAKLAKGEPDPNSSSNKLPLKAKKPPQFFTAKEVPAAKP